MIETVELPGTGRRTTRLGFGGSGLMGGLSERDSLRLLETAYGAGIRHFDVAPSYGHGMAERCLGKFLRGKASEVTVTTKYGILPPQRTSLLGMARNVAHPIARRLPSVRKRLARVAAGFTTKARFSPEGIQDSLEHSLRELGVDHVDLFLLHEAIADDLDGADLLPVLQQMRQRSSIGMFGIGGERSHLNDLWHRHAEYCRVIQFEWSAINAKPDFPGAFCIHHRTVSGALNTIQELFRHDADLCRRWSQVVDADLTSAEILAGLLLSASLMLNPGSIVLFSSRVSTHIVANAHLASDPASAVRAQCLLELLAQQPIAPR